MFSKILFDQVQTLNAFCNTWTRPKMLTLACVLGTCLVCFLAEQKCYDKIFLSTM